MLQKAFGVAGRMDEQPEDIMRELRIRKRLLNERQAIMPLLRFDALANVDFRCEIFDSVNGPGATSNGSAEPQPWPPGRHFRDELENLLYVRNEVFIDELQGQVQQESDDRDEIARHCVMFLGDSIVGGARIWVQSPTADSFAPIHVVILDRLFVIREYRGRRLADAILSVVRNDAKRLALPLFIAIRNEQGEGESRRIRERLISKLAASTQSYRLLSNNAWIPHAGISGNLGTGVFATVFEPCFAAM
jgi:GNAT superfamily N-acetyltransferase